MAFANEQLGRMDQVVGKSSSSEDTRPGSALLIKICDALANIGYSAEVVEKVSGLVEKNTVTAILPQTKDVDAVPERISNLLQSMLDPGVKRSRPVNFNSNEPVMLINTTGDLDHQELGDLFRETLEQLQKERNIWPVRAYAGPFIASELDPGQSCSVTLLNVVNTEIGGPSMVDLLDHHSDSPIWSFLSKGFFKEIWRDRQFVNKLDTGPISSRAVSPDSASEQSENDDEESEKDEGSEAWDASPKSVAEAGDDVDLDIPALEIAGAEHPNLPPIPAPVATNSQPSEAAVEDESTWEDVRARYDSQKEAPPISHPTWEHATRRDSLLDLVTAQAAGVGDPGVEQQQDAAGVTSPRQHQRKGGGSDDDFIVV